MKKKLRKIVDVITKCFIILGIISIICGIVQVCTSKLDFLFYLDEVGSFVFGVGFILCGILAKKAGYAEINLIQDDINSNEKIDKDENK